MLKNKGYPFRNETRCLFKLLLSQWRAEVWWCPERLLGLYTPYQIQILSSGVWWSLLPDICCLWGYNMTSHSRLQTNGLAKFVDITYILFYTHSPYSLYNESLQWT